MHWEAVLPGIWIYRDSCNVYAVEGPGGLLIVDAGTGAWLEQLDELPARPAALALTHYFRDHAAGAARAARAGIPVYVPEYERAILAEPQEHLRRRETYIIYDNLWDLFVPIEPTPVAGVLRDYDTVTLAGIEAEVVPLPGATLTQSGLILETGGRRIAFCGETIHSPGRVARVAPFQYNYNDLPGAQNCYVSAQRLRDCGVAGLLPSLGQPILDDADSALDQLQQSLRALCAGRPGMLGAMDLVHADPVEKVTEHVWKSRVSGALSWFLISRSGKCLALDYGYNMPAAAPPGYSNPWRRRALLHSLDGLKKHTGADRVDVALVSHFHDDHVAGIPVLQRVQGTACWAPEPLADLLEHPEAHCFPCNWPVPIRVDRRIGVDEIVRWEEYTFRFGAMNGHTRFSALIGFEADGKRFVHTGDQYFFIGEGGDWNIGRDWKTTHMMHNHVYRNGALLGGYAQSGKWMLDWRPEIVLNGHQAPLYTDDDFFALIARWSQEYEEIHRRAMALGEEEVHFNLDSWGGWIWPYRTHLAEPGPAVVRVTVRNPYPRAATLDVKLVGPPGWLGTGRSLQADARAEVSADLTITPDGPCRRQPFAVELIANGRPFGQVAEALMTVGGSEF